MMDTAHHTLNDTLLVHKIEGNSDAAREDKLPFLKDFYLIHLFLPPPTNNPGTVGEPVVHYVPEATMYFASPGQGMPRHRESKGYGYAIEFKGDFLSVENLNNRLMSDFPFFRPGLDQRITLYATHQPEIANLCETMLNEYTHSTAESIPIIRAYLNLLLYQAKRIYWRQHENLRLPPLVSSRALTLSLSFRELVSKYICHYKSVEKYASMLDVTPKHLSVVVKQTLDKNASQVIQEACIQEAKKLLKHTDNTITSIAYRLGFKEQSHFNKFFKNHTRQTPQQYRMRISSSELSVE